MKNAKRYWVTTLLLFLIALGNLGQVSLLIHQEKTPLVSKNDELKCCRICRKGKACGDSCINKQLSCHKPPGCACDAE